MQSRWIGKSPSSVSASKAVGYFSTKWKDCTTFYTSPRAQRVSQREDRSRVCNSWFLQCSEDCRARHLYIYVESHHSLFPQDMFGIVPLMGSQNHGRYEWNILVLYVQCEFSPLYWYYILICFAEPLFYALRGFNIEYSICMLYRCSKRTEMKAKEGVIDHVE